MKINSRNGYQKLEEPSVATHEKKLNRSQKLFRMFVVYPLSLVTSFFGRKNDASSGTSVRSDRQPGRGGERVEKVNPQGERLGQTVSAESARSEKSLLAGFDHPYIIKHQGDKAGVFDESESLASTKGCTLDKMIDRIPGDRRYHALHLLSAVTHLHQNNICHMSLKPENVVWNDENGVLLSGLDTAVYAKKSGKLPASFSPDSMTPEYAPPEMFEALECPERISQLNGNAIDSWSLGCTLAEMLTGEPVFSRSDVYRNDKDFKSRFEIPQDFRRKVASYLKKHEKILGSEVSEILKGMLDVKPESRLSLNKALQTFPYSNAS